MTDVIKIEAPLTTEFQTSADIEAVTPITIGTSFVVDSAEKDKKSMARLELKRLGYKSIRISSGKWIVLSPTNQIVCEHDYWYEAWELASDIVNAQNIK